MLAQVEYDEVGVAVKRVLNRRRTDTCILTGERALQHNQLGNMPNGLRPTLNSGGEL